MPQRNPTRFPAGVSNVARKKQFGRIQVFDPARHHIYWDDFDRFAAAEWTVTETQVAATQGIADGDGGWFQHVNTAANNDISSIQKVGLSFAWQDGRALWGKFRFKLDDATLGAAAIGLMVTTTTPFTAPANGIYFLKAAAGTSMILKVGKTSSYTNSTAFGTLANDTFYTVGFHCEGKQFVSPSTGVASYNFDIFFGTSDNPNLITRVQVPATNVPTVIQTPTIALQNGSAVARTMTVDYFGIGDQRF